ncbi:conserved hypothetical protein [Uncinocarpus reesii 1704]|uniref:Prefoldin subunit 5 n=1 Tax=Uncinocarpus reesii (strain UAMH 1704) TaxID=336963 RepID=C4JTZ9_UNCRE|nr:uncharacterized protein UREG_05938 [Uncinocarpus reesii 1704]EEP81096.1 conserved hypothetical protein [Uncinocarpus reesii 1704]
MSKTSAAPEPGAVDITTLSVPQLRSLQTRLNTELEHLTTSHAKLRTAQSKFRECIRSINDGVIKGATGNAEEKSEILVPLTNSLYVKGHLADREKVIVDVGTGFYVEKSTAKATEFYNGKVDELQTNLRDLEKVLQAKSTNLRVIEDVLRQKLLAGEATAEPSSSGGGGGA